MPNLPGSIKEARRAELTMSDEQGATAPRSGPRVPPAARPKAIPKIPGDSWWEENWSSWLRPLLLLVVVGGLYAGHRFGVLSDFETGAATILLAATLGPLGGASATAARLREGRRAGLYAGAALVAVLAALPAVLVLWPGAPLAEGVVHAEGDAVALDGLPGPGWYHVVAGGVLAGVSGEEEVDYALQGRAPDGAAALLRGEVRQSIESAPQRQGGAKQTRKQHSQDGALLWLDPGAPLQLTGTLPASVPGGVRVAVFRAAPVGWWGAGMAALVAVGLLGYELRHESEAGKGRLALGAFFGAGAGGYFARYAVPPLPGGLPGEVARAAVGAVVVGLLAGVLVGVVLDAAARWWVQRRAAPQAGGAA